VTSVETLCTNWSLDPAPHYWLAERQISYIGVAVYWGENEKFE
jgi:hypothetical protein